mmetsp:Transcript_30174/g.36710  ORF Transcript_30174/g.36710 Transcript_30174/m.36710 type:complete len:314 (+) Transcript_30174:1123-2064(+)
MLESVVSLLLSPLMSVIVLTSAVAASFSFMTSSLDTAGCSVTAAVSTTGGNGSFTAFEAVISVFGGSVAEMMGFASSANSDIGSRRIVDSAVAFFMTGSCWCRSSITGVKSIGSSFFVVLLRVVEVTDMSSTKSKMLKLEGVPAGSLSRMIVSTISSCSPLAKVITSLVFSLFWMLVLVVLVVALSCVSLMSGNSSWMKAAIAAIEASSSSSCSIASAPDSEIVVFSTYSDAAVVFSFAVGDGSVIALISSWMNDAMAFIAPPSSISTSASVTLSPDNSEGVAATVVSTMVSFSLFFSISVESADNKPRCRVW